MEKKEGKLQKFFRKGNQDKKKTMIVARKEQKKPVAEVRSGEPEEKKPLLEQKDSDDDDDSDNDVYEDALSELPTGRKEEKKEQGLLPESSKKPDANTSSQSAEFSFSTIWSSGISADKLFIGPNINVVTLHILKQPVQLSPQTPLLNFGQHVVLVTAYCSADEGVTNLDLPPDYLGISVSYTDQIIYSNCVNNGVVTATKDIQPCARNVFCIKSGAAETTQEICYGQYIVFQLIASATPIYLGGKAPLSPDLSRPLRLTTNLNSSCYFKIVHRFEYVGESVDFYPVPTRAAFLIQHVESNLFLTIDCENLVKTSFGMEYNIKLQSLEYINNGVSDKHFFKAYMK